MNLLVGWESSAASPLFALAGQGGLGDKLDRARLQQAYAVGVRARVLEIGWDVLQPRGTDDWNGKTTVAFQERIDAYLATGPDTVVILDLGMQYPPKWVRQIDPLQDQYGNVFTGRVVNIYWSPAVRACASNYFRGIFAHLNFHQRLWAVRVGPCTGELMYPCDSGPNGCKAGAGPDGGQSFWAFDSTAQARAPKLVRGWKPGQPSPHGEAQAFYHWYVDNLDDTFRYIAGELRNYHQGFIAPVTPGQGTTDESAARLISLNLVDPKRCCYGSGDYWQRLFAKLPAGREKILSWCSSFGDGSGSNDDSPNLRDWSAAHRMSNYAKKAGRDIFGENPGRNAFAPGQCSAPLRTTMQWDFDALKRFDYTGLLWIREGDFTNPCCATLENYGKMITKATRKD